MERELLLLGLLRHEDMHGYQLHDFIQRNLDFCTDLKKSTAYYLLEKMEKTGWIEQADESPDPDHNRPPRRVYRITDNGEATFQQLLRDNLAAYFAGHFTGDIGIAFLDTLPPDEALDLLNQRRQRMTDRLIEAQAVPIHSGSMQLVIEHQARHLQAELAWLDSVIEYLNP